VARHACAPTSTNLSFTYLKRSPYPALRSFVMSRHSVRLLSEGRMLPTRGELRVSSLSPKRLHPKIQGMQGRDALRVLQSLRQEERRQYFPRLPDCVENKPHPTDRHVHTKHIIADYVGGSSLVDVGISPRKDLDGFSSRNFVFKDHLVLQATQTLSAKRVVTFRFSKCRTASSRHRPSRALVRTIS
jgi:hypothetical protein